MKILYIANFLPDTNYTRDLSVNLFKIMIPGDILYLCGRKNEPVKDGLKPNVDEVWKKGALFFVPILKYIREKKPDIIHLQHEFRNYGWTSSAVIFPFFILFLRLLGYKIVVTLHGVVSQKQLSKNFLEGFGVNYNIVSKHITSLFLQFIYRSIRLTSNYCTVHTDFLRDILISEYGFNSSKTIVIYHGVRKIKDLNKIPNSPKIFKKFPTLRNKKILLVFGYFSPRKGYEYLINAFSKFIENNQTLNDWVLVLAGDVLQEFTYYKEKIKYLIKSKNLGESILITGFVDKQDIDELYRLTKIVIIPAIFSFNTSGALSIALAYQKPILVADIKPLADEIVQNKFGILYNSLRIDACVSQLKELVKNKSLYTSLMSSLTKSVKKRYWNKIAEEHYSLYKKLLYNNPL